MKKIAFASVFVLMGLAIPLGSQRYAVLAQEKTRPDGYLGAEACKACHSRPAKGEQYIQWRHSPHARAFETLKSERAHELGRNLKLDGPPELSAACLRCHVTAYGVDPQSLGRRYSAAEGVSCESCHGPAEGWKVLHLTDPARARAQGMIVPTREVCVRCHNPESPTHAGFDFERARAAIAHPNPQRAQTGGPGLH